MEKQLLGQEYRLFMLRARICKAYEEGDMALALRLSRRLDAYQQRLWNAQKCALGVSKNCAFDTLHAG